jgi:hypothetical protein
LTDEAGQQRLAVIARDLVDVLGRGEHLLHHRADIQHWIHSQFAQRVRMLGLYLGSALRLGDDALYPPAFALLRCGLEQLIIDELLFLGDRFEQLTETIDEQTWQRWQSTPPRNVLQWHRQQNGRVKIVWSGLHVQDSEGKPTGQTLSIYYQWLQQFDPFALTKGAYEFVAVGHPSTLEDVAEQDFAHREIWRSGLVWQNLKSNLELNQLRDHRTVVQLDVHYRFLSAFVHVAGERAFDLVYPSNPFGAWPRADHYAHELVLLYVCYLAVEGLRTFEAMTHRPPTVDLKDWQMVEERIADAERAMAHAWFPGRPPYAYDRVVEANRGYRMISRRLLLWY